MENQSEYMNYPISDDFMEKVAEQQIEVDRRNRK